MATVNKLFFGGGLCRAERERARVQQQSISNKLFTSDGTDSLGHPVYSPAPQVQQVCQVVDGFIYVANAEPGRGKIRVTLYFLICNFASTVSYHTFWLSLNHEPIILALTLCVLGQGEAEVAQLRAVLSSARDTRPLLVLSCISREELEAASAASLQTITKEKRARCRTPCVDVAKRLGLPKLVNPWMVTGLIL